MERVQHVWEVELQAVLEIVKIGHRKRILHSISGGRTQSQQQPTLSMPATAVEEPAAIPADKPNGTHPKPTAGPPPSASNVLKPSNGSGTVPRTNHGKNRMAPQPPGKMSVQPPPPPLPPALVSNLEIRTPAELLLGVPVGLQASWRHMPADLLGGSIQYDVNVSCSTTS